MKKKQVDSIQKEPNAYSYKTNCLKSFFLYFVDILNSSKSR